MTRRAFSSLGMSRRPVRRAFAALVGLVIVIVGAGLAFLHLPALDDARNRIAANLLSSYLGEPVVVSGGVDVTLGQTIDFSVHGVGPAASTFGRPESTEPVGTMRMSYSLAAALQGRLELTALDLASVRVVIDEAAAEPAKDSLGQLVSNAVEGLLSSPLARSLKLEDVQIHRVNDPAGWNGLLILDNFASQENDRAGSVSIEAKGSLNGQAFTLIGNVPELSSMPESERVDDLSLKLAFKGIEAVLEGRLVRAGGGPTLAARLDVTSQSLGDVQDVLKLARVVEGTGTLRLDLGGALDALTIRSAKLQIETVDGRIYKAEGGVANLWSVDGVAIDFDAILVPRGTAVEKSRFNVTLHSIKGRVLRKEGDLEIDKVIVETDNASIELAKVGPIRIGKIARDEMGHLRLENIRLVQGDPKDPILDLTGNLNNTLELRDFSLEGRFRLGMAVLLTGQRDASGVGALRGKVAMSDVSGRLRLETLDAKLEGTDLMSLSLRLVDKDDSGNRVGLKLDIPDLAPLASALGRKASAGTQIAFDGTVGIIDGAATVRGSGRLGKTELEGRLRIAAPKGKPEIIGRISSKDLHLDSLAAAREVAELLSPGRIGVIKLHEGVADETKLSLDLTADAVEGGSEAAGSLKAHLVYEKSHVRIYPVELVYLGGHIKGDVDANLAPATPAIKLKVTVRKLSLEQMFKRLDSAPAASGPLDLDVSVVTRGKDLHTLLASMNGQVSGAVRGGSLADRTINLAGQTIIEWIFTSTADGSAPLLCAEARFDFKDGVGTTRKLVLETDKVQVVGGGTLNLRDDTVGFVFYPRAKLSELVGSVGPVDVSGPLSKPEFDLADGAVAEKVVGETIGLPLHLLDSLFDADGQSSPKHKPCVIVANGK